MMRERTAMRWLPAIATAAYAMGTANVQAQQGPAPVVCSRVVEQEIRVGETFVGTVRPIKMATIGSAVSGRVIRVLVEEGDLVEDGAPLVELLTATISLERDAAQAELEWRQAQLEELQNGTRPEELDQIAARLQAAEARFEFLKKRRERSTELYNQGQAASRNELDEAISLSEVARATLQESRAAHELAIVGTRKEQIKQAEAQVKMQQAVVDKLEDQIAKHTIRARFRGYVTAKRTEVGSWLQAGEAAIDLVALDTVEIESFVPEKHIPNTRRNMHVAVQLPAISDQLFEGTVAAVVPQADTRARTFPVKVRVKNTITEDGPLIKSGMFARVNLPTGPQQKAILVPKDALVLGGASPVVFVVAPAANAEQPPTAIPVPVTLGAAWGDHMQVSGNLRVGQIVVVEGNERLRPQQPVHVLETREPQLPAVAVGSKANENE